MIDDKISTPLTDHYLSVVGGELEDNLTEAVAMLRRLEWGGAGVSTFGYAGPACPICMASPRDGHSRRGCALADILKKHSI